LEIAKEEERHTQAFEVARVPLWVWEGTLADLGVVSLPPHHHYSSSPLLFGPAAHLGWCRLGRGQFKAQNHRREDGGWDFPTTPSVAETWAGRSCEVRNALFPHVDHPNSRRHPLMRSGPGAGTAPGLFSPSLSPACSPSRLWGQGLPCKSSEFLPTQRPERVASVRLPSQTGNCLPLS